MPPARDECRFRKLRARYTGRLHRPTRPAKGAVSLSWRCYKGNNFTANVSPWDFGHRKPFCSFIKMHTEYINEQEHLIQTRKSSFLNLPETLDIADKKQKQELVKIPHPTPSGHSQRNRATEWGSGSPVGMKLVHVRAGTPLCNLTPRLLFASLNSKEQLNMYIFLWQKRFA